MKKYILFSISVLFLILFFSTCGSEDKKSDIKNDSISSNITETPLASDTVNITIDENTFPNDKKTESITDEKIKPEKNTSSFKKDKIKIIVYYFHATARCVACINIENFTEEVIKTAFGKEKKEGLIIFRQLNIEDSVNEHYIEDYKLEFGTVILAKYINNKQVKWKNLEHVWKYSEEKDKFFKYMKIEIKDFLKEKEGSS